MKNGLEITPRFDELNQEAKIEINRLVNSAASFRNSPELLRTLAKTTLVFQDEIHATIIPKATILLADYSYREVSYTKKFKFEGETFFLHGDVSDWTLSHWATGGKMAHGSNKARLVRQFKAKTRENSPNTWTHFDKRKQSILGKVGLVNE